MAGFKLVWFSLALSLALKSSATEDITISYNDLTYLPSKSQWVEYAASGEANSCAHIATNVAGAAVTYTFTGTAIKFFIPKAGNGAMVRITFSDGSTWSYNSNAATGGGCGSWYGLTFPVGQYKSLSVRLEPTDGQYLNIEKFVVTKLTDAEYQALVAQSAAPSISIQSTQSLASVASVASVGSMNSLNSLASQSLLSIQSIQQLAGQTSAGAQTTQVEVTRVVEIRTTIGTSVATVPVTTTFSSIAGLGGASSNQESGGKKSNVAAIVGGVLGATLGLLLLAILVFLWRRKKRQVDIQPTAPPPMGSVTSQGHTSPPMPPTSTMMYPQQHSMQQAPGHALYPQVSLGSSPMQHSTVWNSDNLTTQSFGQQPFFPNQSYQGPQGSVMQPVTATHVPQPPSSQLPFVDMPPPEYSGSAPMGPAMSRVLPQTPTAQTLGSDGGLSKRPLSSSSITASTQASPQFGAYPGDQKDTSSKSPGLR